jgi:hypothetical protein
MLKLPSKIVLESSELPVGDVPDIKLTPNGDDNLQFLYSI